MAAILDTASWRSEVLTRALVARKDCDILAELIVLRDKGEQSENINQYFEYRRQQDTRYSDPMAFVNTFYNALQSLDYAARFIRTKRFLDLGCAPGGYSTYILSSNPDATGIGITLPVDDGAPAVHIPEELLPRIDIHLADLMTYDLAPSRTPKPNVDAAAVLPPLPIEPSSVDLAICDARWVKHPNNLQRPWNWTRLLVAQLAIALRSIEQGGTLLVRLAQVERTLTGRILLALCRVANLVRCIKSASFQATRSYFYALVQHVDRESSEFGKLVEALEKLWYVMTFEGDEGHGRDITNDDEAMITSEEELTSEEGLAKIVRLGTPVWEVQHTALYGFLSYQGVI